MKINKTLKIDLKNFELNWNGNQIILDFSRKDILINEDKRKTTWATKNKKDRSFQLIVIALLAKIMQERTDNAFISIDELWKECTYFNNKEWKNTPYGSKDKKNIKGDFCNGIYVVWRNRLIDPYLELCPYYYSDKSLVDIEEAPQYLESLFLINFDKKNKIRSSERARYKLGIPFNKITIHDPNKILEKLEDFSNVTKASKDQDSLGCNILTQINKEYIQFFKKTEDLDYESLIGLADGFGIQEPSDGFFKDLYSVHIPEQDTLKGFIQDNKNVLITGKSKVGKTRLVFDVLKNLKDYYVLSLKSSAFTNVDALKISDFFKQKGKKLIWFIDNIDYYQYPLPQDPIWDICAKLCAIDKNTIVIATLRDDMIKPKSRLLEDKRMEPLEFKYKIKPTKAYDFSSHYYPGKKLPPHYDGTFWSIMYGINYMTVIYNDDAKVDGTCKGVMKSLKLLQKILPRVEYTLLKLTFENIYHAFKGTTVFDESIRKLDKIRFLKVDKSNNIVSAQEPYLDKIVDYLDMDSDMEKLINILANNGKSLELLDLGYYYYLRKKFDNSVKCTQHIADNASSHELKFVSYYNWGLALSEIAELQDSKEEQKKYYNIACGKYEEAVDCKNNYAKAYYNWGLALSKLAKLQDNEEERKKLCRMTHQILSKSYLLLILQDKWSLTATVFQIILEIDNTISTEILIFNLGLRATLPNNNKSLLKEDLNSLQKIKGMFSEGDIIINAILENKKPDVAEIPDDDLFLKTAVFLANKIIDRKRNL